MKEFSAITTLSQKCQRCPKVSICDHKYMEHLGYIIPVMDARGNGKLDFQKQYLKAMIKEKYL